MESYRLLAGRVETSQDWRMKDRVMREAAKHRHDYTAVQQRLSNPGCYSPTRERKNGPGSFGPGGPTSSRLLVTGSTSCWHFGIVFVCFFRVCVCVCVMIMPAFSFLEPSKQFAPRSSLPNGPIRRERAAVLGCVAVPHVCK